MKSISNKIRIGTCSWKYDSWREIVYSNAAEINYLKEYSEKFNTVEIDQWFWSLFPPNKVILPRKEDVVNYKKSVSKDFRFTIKVPNSITLTHFYNKNKNEELIKNPFFLSNELFDEFLESIEYLLDQVGCLMFQFEYLNKNKMPSVNHFMDLFRNFHSKLPKNTPEIGIEIRNPNYLNKNYFEFLNSMDIAHVFIHGYYMPSIMEVYDKYNSFIKRLTVIRLHGEDRKGIEKISEGNWSRILIDREKEFKQIASIINELASKNVDVYLNINNHYEGSAPLTIQRIAKYL